MKINEVTKKIEPSKPRNFVAKNAVQSGAGAHKDKKKAEKQGDVKHKNKQFDMSEGEAPIDTDWYRKQQERQTRAKQRQQGVEEGAEFGAYYSEQVAQQIFNKRDDISSEDEVLNQAYHIVANDQGQKSARYMFNYDEDFPSDVVSNYFWLQKHRHSHNVSEDVSAYTVVKTGPEGTQLQSPDGHTMLTLDPEASKGIVKDPSDPNKFLLSKDAAMGQDTDQKPEGPSTGSTVAMTAAEEQEEQGVDGDVGGDGTDAFIQDVIDSEFERAQGYRMESKANDDELLSKMRMIAGLK